MHISGDALLETQKTERPMEESWHKRKTLWSNRKCGIISAEKRRSR